MKGEIVIQLGKARLRLHGSVATLHRYCGRCKNWDCNTGARRRDRVARLLRNRKIQSKMGTATVFQVGCEQIRLTPAKLRLVQRWARAK